MYRQGLGIYILVFYNNAVDNIYSTFTMAPMQAYIERFYTEFAVLTRSRLQLVPKPPHFFDN